MGREERRKGENDGVPSYDTSVQGHTKRSREKKGVPSYDESILHSGTPQKAKREEGEGKGKGVEVLTGSTEL